MSLTWTISPQQAWIPFVDAQVDKVEAEVEALAQSLAPTITAWMKSNHPWRNRTGDAETGLYSLVDRQPRQHVRITFSHGSLIYYGIYLEAHPSWGILRHTVDHFGPIFFSGAHVILRRHIR